MERLIKRLEENNIEYKVCNKNIKLTMLKRRR